MFIRTQPGVYAERSQPSTATLATAKAGRNQLIITNLTGTIFYICMGAGASAGTVGAGGVFDFILKANDVAILDNYTGKITCNPTPTAGQLNVSELFGSKYRASR